MTILDLFVIPIKGPKFYFISTSFVSGLILAPINNIEEPMITLIPKNIGTRFPSRGNMVTAINGAQEPISKPALYTNPLALFLTSVENLSDKKAGIGPKLDHAYLPDG